ncbi:hypothetical protein RUND412_002528 [Rhizina undulata]
MDGLPVTSEEEIPLTIVFHDSVAACDATSAFFAGLSIECLGRGARNPGVKALGLVLAEGRYFKPTEVELVVKSKQQCKKRRKDTNNIPQIATRSPSPALSDIESQLSSVTDPGKNYAVKSGNIRSQLTEAERRVEMHQGTWEYINTKNCRRAVLIGYFHGPDRFFTACNFCDNCLLEAEREVELKMLIGSTPAAPPRTSH